MEKPSEDDGDLLMAASRAVSMVYWVTDRMLPLPEDEEGFGSEADRIAAENWLERFGVKKSIIHRLLHRMRTTDEESHGVEEAWFYLRIAASLSLCELADALKMVRLRFDGIPSVLAPREQVEVHKIVVGAAAKKWSLGIEQLADDLDLLRGELLLFEEATGNAIVLSGEVPRGWEPEIIGEGIRMFAWCPIDSEEVLLAWVEEQTHMIQMANGFPNRTGHRLRLKNGKRVLRNAMRAFERLGIEGPQMDLFPDEPFRAEFELISLIKWLKARIGSEEQVSIGKVPEGARQEKGENNARKLTFSERMMNIVAANQDAVGWTISQWADHLGCARGTVSESSAWAAIRGLADREAERRRLSVTDSKSAMKEMRQRRKET